MLVWCWLIVISHLKPWSGSLPLLMKFRCLSDTVSEFKANKVKNWYSRIHTLKPTQNELEILWGQPIKDDNDRIRAVNSLHQQGVKRIFVYLKDESVFCSDKDGEQFLLTAPAHTTVDSFGADDGFMAGLVYSFLEGYSFRDSARFAIACAAISRASGSLNNPTLSADNALDISANGVTMLPDSTLDRILSGS